MTTHATRNARRAVVALFVANGLLLANMIPWFPAIKSELGLSNATFGLAVAGYPAGALTVGALAGRCIARFGSARTSVYSCMAAAAAVPLVGAAPSLGMLMAAMVLAGAADAIMDTAMNAHGMRVQRRAGRSIINSLHATWSVGAVVGGLVGSVVVGAELSRVWHLLAVALLVAAGVAVASRGLLPGAEHSERHDEAAPDASGGAIEAVRRAPWTTMGLGVLLITATSLEDTAGTWSGMLLDDVLAAPGWMVGLGFAAAQACMVIGRTLGDRVVNSHGPVAVGRGGLTLSALGMVTVALTVHPATALLGFGLSGLGVATLYPLAMTAAAEIPGVRSGDGLTVVTWMGRVGFLALPPTIGLVADATSLPLAMGVVACIAAVGAALATLLEPSS